MRAQAPKVDGKNLCPYARCAISPLDLCLLLLLLPSARWPSLALQQQGATKSFSHHPVLRLPFSFKQTTVLSPLSTRISLHLYRLFVDTSIYPLSSNIRLLYLPSLPFLPFADLISFASLLFLHTTASTSLYIQLLPHFSEISSSSF
ncbi:hypothetical protein WR25_07114 [Diploscapter pachys]|uniref:Uncharacterized protein n=1 Tax=Diploscapter pachys TaxID=2018661 RepID=A0A2A2JEN7_9BILA|nr:hypothetical protein WR25_07114 [Diploscapter pachys]